LMVFALSAVLPSESLTRTVNEYVVAVVGVPDSLPVVDRVIPAGSVPDALEYE